MNPHLALLLSRVYDGAFAPGHLEDLRKSALGDDIIREQHIRSVPPAMFRPLLGYDLPHVVSMLLFPYPGPEGGFMDAVRVKLFPPQRDAKGHAFKYAQPRGSRPRVYFVRRCLRKVLEGDERLLLVEGEKKALALAELGYACVGLAGVEGWHTKGDRRLLTDFDGIQLRNRLVEIVPDGDYQSNADVKRAVQRLGTVLADRGARVRVVLLPQASPQ